MSFFGFRGAIRTPAFGVVYNSDADLEKQAIEETVLQYDDLFTRVVNLVLNIFEWENMPDTVNPILFEKILLEDGKACLYYDNDINRFLGLPCTGATNLNIYRENGFYKVYSVAGWEKFVKALTKWNVDIFEQLFNGTESEPSNVFHDGCICHSNYTQYPMLYTIEIYVKKLVHSLRAIDTASEQLNIPFIIEADTDSINSLRKSINKIRNHIPAIFATKSGKAKLQPTEIKPIGVNEKVLEAEWNHYNNLWGALLTAFGFDNLNTADKKERLLPDEVNSNNEIIKGFLYSMLDARLEFCENFNTVFKPETKLGCKIRHEIKEVIGGEVDEVLPST